MNVIINGKLVCDGEEIIINVEGEEEGYGTKVSDAYVRARKIVLKQEGETK